MLKIEILSKRMYILSHFRVYDYMLKCLLLNNLRKCAHACMHESLSMHANKPLCISTFLHFPYTVYTVAIK